MLSAKNDESEVDLNEIMGELYDKTLALMMKTGVSARKIHMSYYSEMLSHSVNENDKPIKLDKDYMDNIDKPFDFKKDDAAKKVDYADHVLRMSLGSVEKYAIELKNRRRDYSYCR